MAATGPITCRKSSSSFWQFCSQLPCSETKPGQPEFKKWLAVRTKPGQPEFKKWLAVFGKK
jgi:hypothetical protein